LVKGQNEQNEQKYSIPGLLTLADLLTTSDITNKDVKVTIKITIREAKRII